MTRRAAVLAASLGLLAGCAAGPAPADDEPARAAGEGFRAGDCNGVTDGDVARATSPQMFTKAVVNNAGCFWQESIQFGTVGAGMGISTWWYRGSDLDTERVLEQQAGRTLTELSVDGHQGFRAHDTNACSIYVADGDDVITWSIQTMNPAALPDLCAVVDRLARLSLDRVN